MPVLVVGALVVDVDEVGALEVEVEGAGDVDVDVDVDVDDVAVVVAVLLPHARSFALGG